MPQEISTIKLAGVNYHLLKSSKGYVLIDTGVSNSRAFLDNKVYPGHGKPISSETFWKKYKG